MEQAGSAGSLSREQVDLFQHNGYLRVPRAVPAELVDAVAAYSDDQVARRVGEVQWLDPARGVPKRLSFLSERGGPYLDLIRHPAVLDALESIVGPDVEFCHNRHNHLLFKLPGDPGSEFHRDQRGWSRPVVTVVVALDAACADNGCLEVVPGSHRYGAYDRMYTGYHPPARSTHPAGELDAGLGADRLTPEERRLIEQALPVPLAAGDMLLMHCCVLHGSAPNASDRTRRSVTLAYHGADELQPPEATFTMLVRGERREAKPGYRYVLRA